MTGLVQGQTAPLDTVPGKRSETLQLARAAAREAEGRTRLAKEAAAESVAESKPKDGKPSKIEQASDGSMRIRASADPQKAVDAIRERLSLRGVERRIDAEGNSVLRVGAAEAKTVSAGRAAALAPVSMTSMSTRKTASAAVHGEVGASTTRDARHGDAKHGDAKHNAAPTRATAHAPHWSYEGEASPDQWARLSPEWASCAKGSRQSPIDIHDGIKVDLESVRFEYRPSAFTVVDNGHTIQVDLPPGNAITVAGKRYELLQFHFHKPAEERVDGKPFDMVVHLVHKDANGKLAVVAVLLEKGSAQEVVQSVWNHLPLERGGEVEAGVPLDPTALLPAERGYYTYMGSLTTPPCSEGVLWMVMKQPVGISPEQLAIFARLYPMNARPIQAASARLIKESN